MWEVQSCFLLCPTVASKEASELVSFYIIDHDIIFTNSLLTSGKHNGAKIKINLQTDFIHVWYYYEEIMLSGITQLENS